MIAPTALVTGAPGWLGTRLVETLIHGLPDVPSVAPAPAGRRVRCLVLPGTDSSPLKRIAPSMEVVEGDLADGAGIDAFFNGADGATLFHAAGVIHPTRGTKQFYRVNAEGTQRIVDAARRAKVRRLVHVSSNSPFGFNPTTDSVFDELSPYHPYMGYGRSKMVAEQIVRSARLDGSLETVVIRPPWFYGPGQPPRQGLFFRMIKEGKVPLLGQGDNRRSMAYIDNICQGLLLCERIEPARGQVYWIADRRPYAMNEILDTIEHVLERDFQVPVAHKRRRLPGFASSAAWMIDGTLQSLGFYHPKIHVLSEMNRTIACTIAKAERELGYDPKVELAEGIRRSIRWMLDNGLSI
jgi:nucleoside-diphosphate-sugar epimerase